MLPAEKKRYSDSHHALQASYYGIQCQILQACAAYRAVGSALTERALPINIASASRIHIEQFGVILIAHACTGRIIEVYGHILTILCHVCHLEAGAFYGCIRRIVYRFICG